MPTARDRTRRCDVALGLSPNVAVDELFQRLDGEVLLVGLAHFGKELVCPLMP
jgi:hypothetical protein